MNVLKHSNNFGFLRLFLATLVIVSHSPEIIDGNRSRELLVNLLGSRTFGELAVEGFFLISGYLILKSFIQSKSVGSYLSKRIRRIFPGYLIAYLVCVFVVAPWVGTKFSALTPKDYVLLFADAIGLQGPPPTISSFTGLPYPELNGSMWTISFEFRCYLMVILFAAIGLYRNRWLFLAATVGLLVWGLIGYAPSASLRLQYFIGNPIIQIRLLATFCVGGCFFMFRDLIKFNGWGALLAACILITSMYFKTAEQAAFAVFGGYLIFWCAFALHSETMARVNSDDDISYGVYLYAWPVSSLIVYFWHVRSPWFLIALTIPISYAIGFISWKLVEAPVTRHKATPKLATTSLPAE